MLRWIAIFGLSLMGAGSMLSSDGIFFIGTLFVAPFVTVEAIISLKSIGNGGR